MTIAFWLPAFTAFVACGVEAVEALTIVLAVGHSRSWRSALSGAAWAVIVLAAIVAIVLPILGPRVPIVAIRFVAGAVALYYGYGWTKKAILRASGRKALRDENAIYAREISATQHDRGAFTTAFNGVFIEGVEVVVIVISLGAATAGALVPSIVGALISVVVVTLLGIVLRKPAARVPENLMKLIVGVMLLAFGTFWLVEGLRIDWPLGDLTLPLLAIGYALITAAAIVMLRRRPAAPARP